MLVNILTYGFIPELNLYGPKTNVKITKDLYESLVRKGFNIVLVKPIEVEEIIPVVIEEPIIEEEIIEEIQDEEIYEETYDDEEEYESEMEEINLENFTVKELRAMCEEQGLPTNGTKSDLIERLS